MKILTLPARQDESKINLFRRVSQVKQLYSRASPGAKHAQWTDLWGWALNWAVFSSAKALKNIPSFSSPKIRLNIKQASNNETRDLPNRKIIGSPVLSSAVGQVSTGFFLT